MEIEEIPFEIIENIFLDPHWRTTVKNWIDTEDSIDEEIEKINSSLVQLVRDKNLELLFIIMRFLHRVIEDSDKNSWKIAYKHIFYENLQDEMRKVFNRKLSAPYEF
jgi:hypothetical protein